MVERLHDESTVIVKDMFQKDTALERFIGLAVTLSTGEKGLNTSEAM